LVTCRGGKGGSCPDHPMPGKRKNPAGAGKKKIVVITFEPDCLNSGNNASLRPMQTQHRLGKYIVHKGTRNKREEMHTINRVCEWGKGTRVGERRRITKKV